MELAVGEENDGGLHCEGIRYEGFGQVPRPRGFSKLFEELVSRFFIRFFLVILLLARWFDALKSACCNLLAAAFSMDLQLLEHLLLCCYCSCFFFFFFWALHAGHTRVNGTGFAV